MASRVKRKLIRDLEREMPPRDTPMRPIPAGPATNSIHGIPVVNCPHCPNSSVAEEAPPYGYSTALELSQSLKTAWNTHLQAQWQYERAFNWHTSRDGAAMLRHAVNVGVDRRLIVLAACKIARAALRFAPTWQVARQPLRTIRSAEHQALTGKIRHARVDQSGRLNHTARFDHVELAANRASAVRWSDTGTAHFLPNDLKVAASETSAWRNDPWGSPTSNERGSLIDAYCADVIREVIPYPRSNSVDLGQRDHAGLRRPRKLELLDWAPHCLVYRTGPARLGLQLGLPHIKAALDDRISGRAPRAAPRLWQEGHEAEIVECIPDPALMLRVAKRLESEKRGPLRYGDCTMYVGGKEVGRGSMGPIAVPRDAIGIDAFESSNGTFANGVWPQPGSIDADPFLASGVRLTALANDFYDIQREEAEADDALRERVRREINVRYGGTPTGFRYDLGHPIEDREPIQWSNRFAQWPRGGITRGVDGV